MQTASLPTKTFTYDTAVPTGGTGDATGLVGAGGRYSTTLGLTIAFTKGSDSSGFGSGATLSRQQGSLSSDGVSDGQCTGYGAFTQIGGSDPTSTISDTVPTDNACYRYQYSVPDAAGNVALYLSGDIKVETTAPGSLTPTFTYSNVTGTVFPSGSTIYFRDLSNGSGSFTGDSKRHRFAVGRGELHVPGIDRLDHHWNGGVSHLQLQRHRTGVTGDHQHHRDRQRDQDRLRRRPDVHGRQHHSGGDAELTGQQQLHGRHHTNSSGPCTTSAGTVTITITGPASQTRTATCSSSSYSTSASPALGQGTYTAQASQTVSGHTGSSTINTFTIDTVAPTISNIAVVTTRPPHPAGSTALRPVAATIPSMCTQRSPTPAPSAP